MKKTVISIAILLIVILSMTGCGESFEGEYTYGTDSEETSFILKNGEYLELNEKGEREVQGIYTNDNESIKVALKNGDVENYYIVDKYLVNDYYFIQDVNNGETIEQVLTGNSPIVMGVEFPSMIQYYFYKDGWFNTLHDIGTYSREYNKFTLTYLNESGDFIREEIMFVINNKLHPDVYIKK